MRDFIKKYELYIFLVLGPLVNVVYVYARYLDIIPKAIYNNGRFLLLLFLLICIVAYTRGIMGVKDIFKPMTNWKVNPKWYVFSLFFAFTVGLITLLLKGIYSGGDYTEFVKVNFGVFNLRSVVALFVWAFLGEVVWVSYCIRELSKIIKPFYASQIIGLFWTLWWIPIIILGEGVLPGIPIVSLGIFMLGIAGMCTVVYRLSKSGICVLILQFTLNLSLNALSISPSTGGVTTFTAYSIVYFLTMLGFMYLLYPLKKVKLIEPL
ncbi:hypothetical protein LX77_01740 [Gelidibacter algens]|uniref:CAAX prenyl protease-like protein n=1 Tax=Gelidibacter algens TaxID=49280 RepID=A0A327S9W4_9FLAO|nr:hypothetical protein [Gelidibacter algens]RAJ24744.1 hypothetical protein LX77_01740 [Gelidibacter algens]